MPNIYLTFFLIILLVTIISIFFYKLYTFRLLEKINFHQQTDKPSILLICSETRFGGGEVHTLSLYKKLLKKKCNLTILVVKNSTLQKRLKQLHLPYYACGAFRSRIFGFLFKPGKNHLSQICKEQPIKIIHCSSEKEVSVARSVSKQLAIHTILTRHILGKLRYCSQNDLTALICVSKKIATDFTKEESKHPKQIITNIPPVYNYEKFENHKPQKNKAIFFRKNNITLNNNPLLSTIGNLSSTKNQRVLFQAIHKLKCEKKKIVQLILAGKGSYKRKLKKLAQKLEINEQIHFLGFTDAIPDLLFFSDINILPSKKEGLGIALLEASHMKKPSIVSSNTGMSDVVIHNKTGLQFENNNADDLAEKIETLIDNPKNAKKLGLKAYSFVKNNFSTKSIIKKHIDLYNKIIHQENSLL